MSQIATNTKKVLAELPRGVELVVVAKGRQPAEVVEAVEAGAGIIGENYVQEAEKALEVLGCRVQWHFVGHLQKNKIKKAVGLFDMIQTVDSLETAREIDLRCAQAGKVLPALIEVNIGREEQKSGVLPEMVEAAVGDISTLHNINVVGLMTMGPALNDPADLRPYFRKTRQLFESLVRSELSNLNMKYLSMGMSDSYRLAIDEGANMVRLGRAIFGERPV